jgi:septum formation protein
MLLEQVGIPFVAIPPDADEEIPDGSNFDQVVVRNAVAKALSVVHRAEGRAIIGADTVVNLDGRPLGKPGNRDEASAMLHQLSGRTQIVHSGIVLVDPDNWITYRNSARTKVHFRRLSDLEIDAYIESGEPFDKAGAYGIQARGALFIDRVEGCFFNVMGLPLSKLWEMLIRWMEEIHGKNQGKNG